MMTLFRSPFTIEKMTVIIGLISLIILLLIVGTTFRNILNNTEFPPKVSQCPDYFEVIDNDICANKLNMGSCPGDQFDFSDSKFKGVTGYQEKYKRSLECDWEWDGITNNSKYM